MNVLTYVHLRNIYGSTGAGRVARQITEHLAQQPDIKLHILADSEDYHKTVYKVGTPWTDFSYHFFRSETSWQQARWVFTGNPVAESFWPETQIVYCTAESYVPTEKARLVVTLHDAAFFERDAHQANWSVLKQKVKWKLLYSLLAKKADLFHTVSNFSAERIAHFFPDIQSRLRVIHNGVPPRFFAPISAEGEKYLQKLGLSNQPFILLPRGLHYRKNAELVLKAWPILQERYPNLKIVVTSHCDPIYIKQAKAMGDSVLVTGFVSDEALCSLYHAAQVVWFPSLYEGFGIPVLEAMACGTPVIVSDSSSLPEVAGDAAILVSTTSITEHIDAIDTLLKDLHLREELIKRGKDRAKLFTWQRSATQLQQYFLSLL